MRKDGRPVPLPLWFGVVDRRIYISTPEGSKKVKRIRNDNRATFLVESGKAWVELSAVIMQGDLIEVTEEDEQKRVQAVIDAKYRDYRIPIKKVPDATRDHYTVEMAMFRFEPIEKPLTWDNARIQVRSPA